MVDWEWNQLHQTLMTAVVEPMLRQHDSHVQCNIATDPETLNVQKAHAHTHCRARMIHLKHENPRTTTWTAGPPGVMSSGAVNRFRCERMETRVATDPLSAVLELAEPEADTSSPEVTDGVVRESPWNLPFLP